MALPVLDERVAEARRLFAAGMSKAEIARELAVAESTVYAWVGELRRPAAKMSKPQHYDEARAMRAQGLSNVEIGRKLGITRQRVAQLLGPAPHRPPLERTHLTLAVPPETRERLKRLAKALGLTVGRGSESKEGSIAQLLEGLASGEIVASRRDGGQAPR